MNKHCVKSDLCISHLHLQDSLSYVEIVILYFYFFYHRSRAMFLSRGKVVSSPLVLFLKKTLFVFIPAPATYSMVKWWQHWVLM